MRYEQTVYLKNGAECQIRSAAESDAEDICSIFRLTHAQTDFLLSYPDECSLDAGQERQFLRQKENSENEIELCAVLGGRIVGIAGIQALGNQYKLRHRAEFGVSVAKDCWHLGIGRALLAACIDCACRAGYAQLELDVVSENVHALDLYKSMGFVEYGRNPRGFRSRSAGWQELVLMRRELGG